MGRNLAGRLSQEARRRLIAVVALLPALPVLAAIAPSAPPTPEQYRAEAQELEASWTPERAALGKRLFQERRLSRDGTLSCQDCHHPDHAYTDGRKTAVGVKGRVGGRNTPTIINRALGSTHFWDGRAATLEEQALGPIAAPGEMDLPIDEAVARLAADPSYRREFQNAFGGGPTPPRMGAAIAAYERTVYSVRSPFDRFIAGDENALSPAARRGLAVFGGKARCGECHTGINFTDESFHCLGIHGDEGRGRVTRAAADAATFKTPTLREIARTAPYMHDGSLATLAEVVDYYDKGGTPHPNMDSKMGKLGLTAQEKADLVAFLEALSGTVVETAGTTTAGATR